ncbi:putative 2og-fe oxygenase family protein [Phaeomoniella chlamydospora]|uniref:uS12 prolyl 3,4-dihydroxylase n=1 Tax=Phaeomoniella chlamydospora TaxID=158046 RepID=A0A0G2DSB5_PHACM|nr:putative 2og-fe oxygenase family protein [Phaeomoniella chlamydospora]
MKRKAEDLNGSADTSPQAKRKALYGTSIESRFTAGLFDSSTLEKFTSEYEKSQPYKHAVIPSLIEHSLLRSVREEIIANVHFTPKETDIYKIHQSGDLANLDGLDDSALAKLPSLLSLRDALYSAQFREYVSHITGAGKLSGKKTDMAINVYTPGCHLLCHDDVIGSRRVSYILYLTDPDRPWKAEWGGALRLYPTETKKTKDGEEIKTPSHDFTVSIPPAFSQLSFFAVQPGESYHDVEEVYHGETEDESEKRTRMAISGWFHIPQEGEDGYEEGLEEQLAVRSSLSQLQSRNDEFDIPQRTPVSWESAPSAALNGDSKGKGKALAEEEDDDGTLTEKDLDFLLKYIAPSFLTPDMTEQLEAAFTMESLLSIDRFLSDKFATRVSEYVEQQEASSKSSDWPIAEPPFKHRYAFLQPSADKSSDSPIQELINILFPSQAFRKWLAQATGLHSSNLISHNLLARRFRRGQDYALASGFNGDDIEHVEDDAASQPSDPDAGGMRIEFTLNLTPTSGWEPLSNEDCEEEEEDAEVNGDSSGRQPKANGHGEGKEADAEDFNSPGGEEVYMAADDDDAASVCSHNSTSQKKKSKSDPAVYKSKTEEEDDDDGILFTNPPSWNTLSIVLRDEGTLRFVKYVSQNAKGDRWDIKGEIGCWGVGGEGEFEDDEDLEEDEDAEDDGGEEWAGIEDSDDDNGNGIPEKSDDEDSD